MTRPRAPHLTARALTLALAIGFLLLGPGLARPTAGSEESAAEAPLGIDPGALAFFSPELAAQYEGTLLLGEGERLAQQGEWEAAREAWQAAEEAYRRAGETSGVASARFRQGFSYIESGEYLGDKVKGLRGMGLLLESMLTAASVVEEEMDLVRRMDVDQLAAAKSLFNEGMDALRGHRCGEALPVLVEARSACQRLGHDLGEMLALMAQAHCQFEIGDSLTGLPLWLEGLQLYADSPIASEIEAMDEHRMRVGELMMAGHLEEAQALEEKQLERYHAASDAVEAVKAQTRLGVLKLLNGDLQACEEILREALETAVSLPTPTSLRQQAEIRDLLGNTLSMGGHFQAAGGEIREAAGLWKSLSEPGREAASLGMLATALAQQSRLVSARAVLERAKSLRQRLPAEEANRPALLSALGMAHISLGEIPMGMSYLAQGIMVAPGSSPGEKGANASILEFLNLLTMASPAGSSPGSGLRDSLFWKLPLTQPALVGLKSLLGALPGSSPPSEEELLAALISSSGRASPQITVMLLNSLADRAAARGDTTTAIGRLREALEVLRANDPVPGDLDGPVLARLAELLEAHGDREEAARIWEQLSALAEKQDSPWLRLLMHSRRIIEANRQQDRAALLAEAKAAQTLLGSMETSPRLGGVEKNWLQQVVDMMAVMGALVAAHEDDAQEAFLFAEKARAQAFLASLGNEEIEIPHQGSSVFVEKEKALRRELRRFTEERRSMTEGKTPQVEMQALEAALAKARREYSEILPLLRIASPEYAQMVTVDVLDLPTLQREVLPPETTLIEYLVMDIEIPDTPASSFAWVIDREGATLVPLAVTNRELHRQIEHWRRLLSVHAPEAEVLAGEIHRLIFAPLLPHIRHRRLILAPHGPLHYLPFAALRDAGSGRWLVEEYTLSYTPSASALRFLATGGHRRGNGRALALGDVDRGHPLPAAAREAREVARLTGGQGLVGEEATEGRLRSDLSGYGILHVAAHAVYEPITPLFSRLLLGPGPVHDGLLTALEIYSLDLTNTPLVVLSACQTQLGPQNPTSLGVAGIGEEMVALHRAFLSAGASTIVATQWAVGDEPTAFLLQSFYGLLREGQTAVEALRQAQLAVRERFPHPYDWAAFGVTGDGEWSQQRAEPRGPGPSSD